MAFDPRRLNQFLANPYTQMGANMLANNTANPFQAVGQAMGATGETQFNRGATAVTLNQREQEVKNRKRYADLAEQEAKVVQTQRKLRKQIAEADAEGDKEAVRRLSVELDGLSEVLQNERAEKQLNISAGQLGAQNERIALEKQRMAMDEEVQANLMAGQQTPMARLAAQTAARDQQYLAGQQQLDQYKARLELADAIKSGAPQNEIMALQIKAGMNLKPADPAPSIGDYSNGDYPMGDETRGPVTRYGINPNVNMANFSPAAANAIHAYISAINSGDAGLISAAERALSSVDLGDDTIENIIQEIGG